jgi:peptidoglycan hydrolase-like protein with peptidoglycan-binding domain
LRFVLVTGCIVIFAACAAGAQDASGANKSSSTASKAKTTRHRAPAKTVPKAPLKAISKTTTKAVSTKAAPSPAAISKASSGTANKNGTRARTLKKPASVAVSRRSAQQQPTQQRYKEIQETLAERGYFSGVPDGTWGPGSIDALRHFQRDQNLTDDGKIGSLSLIALGLGPKRPAQEPVSDKSQQP